MDAIQLFVRGFHDRQTGNRIRKALDSLGFDVKCAIDGESDDLGGIIETYITPVLELETHDLGEIKEAIYKAANDVAVFCQWSLFVKTAESEF